MTSPVATPLFPSRDDDSPFPSVYSDVTMDEDEEYEHFFAGPNHMSSSLLEYSDDTPSEDMGGDETSPKPKSKFRARRDSSSESSRRTRVMRFRRDSSSPGTPEIPQKRPFIDEENQHSNHRRTTQQRPQQQRNTSEFSGPHWMKRWASSFRSPSIVRTKKQHKSAETTRHKRGNSAALEEYPHYSSTEGGPPPPPLYDPWTPHEMSPLLRSPAREVSLNADILLHPPRKGDRPAVVIAAAFLQDYEAGRPPTFGTAELEDISDRHLGMYHLKNSWMAATLRALATASVFASSFMEGSYAQSHRWRYWATGLNLFGILVFAVDLGVRRELRRYHGKRPMVRRWSALDREEQRNVRISRSEFLVVPVAVLCLFVGVENVYHLVSGTSDLVLFSSIFKPIVFFYVSSQARDAFGAVRRILKIVLRVLVMELLLILMFAAVACRLFSDFEGFNTLAQAWLSLFELATTVVNPSIWMPMYKESKYSALFFVTFIVITVFYLHSLVLSVVFQTYIQAATEIHERHAEDREAAVHLAFQVLLQDDCESKIVNDKVVNDQERNVVDVAVVRETLRVMRPHYNPMKITALVEIVDPSNQGVVDYESFRTKIRSALNASVRTARSASILAMSVEFIAVTVAIVNFVYVLLVSSPFSAEWFDTIQLDIGCLITMMGAFELLIRFNPLRYHDFTPLTRINVAFDGSALVAALVSTVGIFMYLAGVPDALEFILIGRSLDIVRAMRFFQIFRDVVRRTSDVVPALEGPVVLVVSTMHVFVYVGILLWGGSVDVGQHEGAFPELYDLNNFNSYQEGTVTMFQLLVVNDWYAIAEVYRYADRCSQDYYVFPFFILSNLVGVSVMLNVLTAFFVESFVTKLNNDVDAPAEATATMHRERERDFTIQSSERPIKRVSSGSTPKARDPPYDADADSEASSESERFEFDVYEREGYDKIMQTVSGSYGLVDADMARNVCAYLEIYESLSPGREPVGYLVCDQRTLERFGNRRFKTKSIGYLDENMLHAVVTDMHSELLALSHRPNFNERALVRTFPHKRDPNKALEISASLLRRNPALSLFVARSYHHGGSRTPPLPDLRKR